MSVLSIIRIVPTEDDGDNICLFGMFGEINVRIVFLQTLFFSFQIAQRTFILD